MTLDQLSAEVVDAELVKVLSRWQPEPNERLAFRAWALMMLDVCESLSRGDSLPCVRDLEQACAALNGDIAERLMADGIVDLVWVSRAAWLSFIIRTLRHRGDEPALASVA